MEGESVLQMIAEASVAFAGFTGVVAVLGTRSTGRWRPLDVIRFRMMVTTSLLTLGFALLPALLHYVGVSPRVYWTISSALLGAALPVVLWRSIALQREYKIKEDPGFVPGFRLLSVVVVLTATVSQFMNVLGIGLDRTFGGYLIGLLAFLFLCAGMFVLLLRFVRFEEDEP